MFFPPRPIQFLIDLLFNINPVFRIHSQQAPKQIYEQEKAAARLRSSNFSSHSARERFDLRVYDLEKTSTVTIGSSY